MGSLGTFTKGAPLSKADISETGFPFILYGELYTTYKEVTYHVYRQTDANAPKECFSNIGDVIIPTSGETPEEIATATCVMVPNVILGGDLNIYRNNAVDGRIISYIINHKINKNIYIKCLHHLFIQQPPYTPLKHTWPPQQHIP